MARARATDESEIIDLGSTDAPVEGLADESTEETPAADWDFIMGGAERATSYVRGPRIDVTETVPQPVRDAVERSYEEYFQEVQHQGATLAPGTPKYFDIDLGSEEKVAEFKKHVARYAKGRPLGRISVRAYVSKATPTVVHFAAMPAVSRPRKAATSTENGPFDVQSDPQF